MSTWFEPSGFIVQMSLFFTNAILPFAPGKVAWAPAGEKSASAIAMTPIPALPTFIRSPKVGRQATYRCKPGHFNRPGCPESAGALLAGLQELRAQLVRVLGA